MNLASMRCLAENAVQMEIGGVLTQLVTAAGLGHQAIPEAVLGHVAPYPNPSQFASGRLIRRDKSGGLGGAECCRSLCDVRD